MQLPFDLTEAAAEVIAFRDSRDWAQFHAPKNLPSAMAVEVGEFFLWASPEPAATVRGDAALIDRVNEELADVLIYALTLASDLELDLDNAIRAKVRSNERRYPAEKVRGRAGKSKTD